MNRQATLAGPRRAAAPDRPGGDRLVEALRDATGPRARDALVVADGGPDWADRYRALGHRVRTLALRGREPPPLPLDDASLDLLHVHGLAETLAHPGAQLAEWLRVLRPGGVLLVSGGARAGRATRTRGGRVFADGLRRREAAALLEVAGLRGVDARRLPAPGAPASGLAAWWRRGRSADALYLAWGRR